MIKQLTLSDLQIGMKVRFEQLQNIYDTWILVEESKVGSEDGIVRFIGKHPNSESQAILEEGKPIGCIYNDSLDSEMEFIG